MISLQAQLLNPVRSMVNNNMEFDGILPLAVFP